MSRTPVPPRRTMAVEQATSPPNTLRELQELWFSKKDTVLYEPFCEMSIGMRRMADRRQKFILVGRSLLPVIINTSSRQIQDQVVVKVEVKMMDPCNFYPFRRGVEFFPAVKSWFQFCLDLQLNPVFMCSALPLVLWEACLSFCSGPVTPKTEKLMRERSFETRARKRFAVGQPPSYGQPPLRGLRNEPEELESKYAKPDTLWELEKKMLMIFQFEQVVPKSSEEETPKMSATKMHYYNSILKNLEIKKEKEGLAMNIVRRIFYQNLEEEKFKEEFQVYTVVMVYNETLRS